jgi:hypothetical protein
MIGALHTMANSQDTTIKTFEFKLRTNKRFVEACERELEHSRQIYNAALAERISCYRITGASLGITAFATLSNGKEIENPRHLKNALDNLQRYLGGRVIHRVKSVLIFVRPWQDKKTDIQPYAPIPKFYFRCSGAEFRYRVTGSGRRRPLELAVSQIEARD